MKRVSISISANKRLGRLHESLGQTCQGSALAVFLLCHLSHQRCKHPSSVAHFPRLELLSPTSLQRHTPLKSWQHRASNTPRRQTQWQTTTITRDRARLLCCALPPPPPPPQHLLIAPTEGWMQLRPSKKLTPRLHR